jgi:NAD(P)-dependent dehydrogenase (short-subunit alcohol dehydrogenase family)
MHGAERHRGEDRTGDGAARRRSIGRATALRLAAEGADVACLDIGRPYEDFPAYGVAAADELDEVVREIEKVGRRALALRADRPPSRSCAATTRATSPARR